MDVEVGIACEGGRALGEGEEAPFCLVLFLPEPFLLLVEALGVKGVGRLVDVIHPLFDIVSISDVGRALALCSIFRASSTNGAG